MNIGTKLQILAHQEHPVRFILSRLLPLLGVKLRLDFWGVTVRMGHSKLAQSLFVEGGEQRREDAEMILNSLKPGDIYIDVGANIGTLALLAGKAVGNQGLSLAIEANKHTFSELVGNIKENDLYVVPILSAVGHEIGVVRFSNSSTDDQNNVDDKGELQVPVTRLDALLPAFIGDKRVNLLKIDVEGFECRVLEGLSGIADRVDKIYFEISEAMLNRYGFSCADLLSKIQAYGFDIYDADGQRVEATGRVFERTSNLLAVRRGLTA